jgi:tRNA (guanine-N7-)-methyltransferase
VPRIRVRQHVNPHRVEYRFPHAARLSLPPDRDVDVDIGCADAQFLFQRAAVDPSREYIGLEIRDEFVAVVNQRARAAGLPVRALFAHANVHVRQMFAPGSIARVYVNFPDPWFKRYQRNRRVLDGEFAHDLAVALRPGGELFFQSDVFDLALDAMAVLEESDRFGNRAGAWTFWKGGNPFGVTSSREDSCVARGLPIWRLWYVSGARGPCEIPRERPGAE